MSLTITTLTLLSEYINGVMSRADHHGLNVNEVVLTIAGGVIWKATQDVEVRTYKDETANILWLNVNQNRYVLAFNHRTANIELRERNQNGNVIAEFNNSTSTKQVKTIFSHL